MTHEELEAKFAEFDRAFFEGRLSKGTTVRVMSAPPGHRLDEAEFGVTDRRGEQVFVNPMGDHEWQYTLLHEMVHAFENRFGEDLAETDEAKRMERFYGNHPIYGRHSARFLAKLAAVMRVRGDDPGTDFHRYFG